MRRRFYAILARLPDARGRPIRIALRPALSAWRGRLLSGKEIGISVHAATFLRRRRIVLDTELPGDPRELARILIHEIFHFVWLRLGNARRGSFDTLLAAELRRRARGELGWSAELRKGKLTPVDREIRTRRWREYVCESFCDSAAWLFSSAGRHAEFTLAGEFRRKRRQWFRHAGVSGGI